MSQYHDWTQAVEEKKREAYAAEATGIEEIIIREQSRSQAIAIDQTDQTTELPGAASQTRPEEEQTRNEADGQKATSATSEEREYLPGLPFTIDYRKMLEKTKNSRFTDPNQDIIELTKLGVENSDSFVKISKNRRGISVEFDGPGISSKDELIRMIFSIYGSGNKEENRFGRFGTALLAGLAKNPESIKVETRDGGNSLAMEIDSQLKPRVYAPRSEIKHNKITIVNRPRRLKDAARYLKTDITQSLKDLESIIRANPSLRETISETGRYTDKKVTYNGKRISQGFAPKDTIIMSEYEIDGSRIAVSVPKNNSELRRAKTAHFLRGDLPVGKRDAIEPPEDRYRNWKDYDNFIRTPDVIVTNGGLKQTIKGDLLEDHTYETVKNHIKQAVARFNEEVMSGKFDDKVSVKDSKDYERFKTQVILGKFRSEYSTYSTKIDEYMTNKERYLNSLDENERAEIERMFGKKFFKLASGKQFTMPEMYMHISDLVKAGKEKVYYTLSDKFNPHHPIVWEQKIDGEQVVSFENKTELEIFETLFRSLNVAKDYSYSRKFIGVESIDELVKSFDTKKKQEKAEKRERMLNKAARGGKKAAIATGAVTATGGAGLGIYLAAPYVASAASFVYEHALDLFNLINHAAVYTGVATAAGGTYAAIKAAPHIKKGIVMTGRGAKKAIKGGYEGLEGIVSRGSHRISTTLDRISLISDKLQYSMKDGLFKFRKKKETAKAEQGDSDGQAEEAEDAKVETPEMASKNYVRDYLRAIETDIRQISDPFGGQDVFRNIREIKIENTMSRKEFKLKKIKGEAEAYALTINIGSGRFKKKASEYQNTPLPILMSSLQDIAMKIGKKRDAAQYQIESFEKMQMSKLYFSELDRLFSMYLENDEGFKEVFDRLDDGKEKRYILKRVIKNSEGRAAAPLDQWLAEKYDSLLGQVAEEIIEGKDIKTLERADHSDREEAIIMFNYLTEDERLAYLKDAFSKGKETFVTKHISDNQPVMTSYLQNQLLQDPLIDEIITAYRENDADRLVALLDRSGHALGKRDWEYVYGQTAYDSKPEKTPDKDVMDGVIIDRAKRTSTFSEENASFEHQQNLDNIRDSLRMLTRSKEDKYLFYDRKTMIRDMMSKFYRLPASKKIEYLKALEEVRQDDQTFEHYISMIAEAYPQYFEETGGKGGSR